MTLLCALCLFSGKEEASEADTIMNGHAVCMDHTPFVQGGAFSQALVRVLEQENYG